MAVQAAAKRYSNFTLNDVFSKPRTESKDDDFQRALLPNLLNECRFAVPPVAEVREVFCVAKIA